LVALEKGAVVNLLSFIHVLRALDNLDVFQHFVPEPEFSPLQVAEQ
jgi:hypothetical protein